MNRLVHQAAFFRCGCLDVQAQDHVWLFGVYVQLPSRLQGGAVGKRSAQQLGKAQRFSPFLLGRNLPPGNLLGHGAGQVRKSRLCRKRDQRKGQPVCRLHQPGRHNIRQISAGLNADAGQSAAFRRGQQSINGLLIPGNGKAGGDKQFTGREPAGIVRRIRQVDSPHKAVKSCMAAADSTAAEAREPQKLLHSGISVKMAQVHSCSFFWFSFVIPSQRYRKSSRPFHIAAASRRMYNS